MKYIHTKCGGEIDVGKRTCTNPKCKKKWNAIMFLLDSGGIRPKVEAGDIRQKTVSKKVERLQKERESSKLTKTIVEKFPGAGAVVAFLPNCPRWARILTTVVVLGGLVYLVIWLT